MDLTKLHSNIPLHSGTNAELKGIGTVVFFLVQLRTWVLTPNDQCPRREISNVVVQDDPKLLDDSGEVPKPNGVVGNLIPGREIISLLDEKLVKWWSPPKELKKIKESKLYGHHLRCIAMANDVKIGKY